MGEDRKYLNTYLDKRQIAKLRKAGEFEVKVRWSDQTQECGRRIWIMRKNIQWYPCEHPTELEVLYGVKEVWTPICVECLKEYVGKRAEALEEDWDEDAEYEDDEEEEAE